APPACAGAGDGVRAARRCAARAPRAWCRRAGAAGVAGPSSELRADAQADGERRVRIVQPARDVQAQRPHRRAPARTDANAGVPVGRGAVEGAAAVDEHRRAPVAEEIALIFDTGGEHVARAGGQVAGLAQVAVFVALVAGQARADLAPFVAADAALAAGVEAQARRHVDQGAGP